MQLLPASFRGVPFAVLDQSTQVGRRIAVHEYPGRDEPWAEDLGRGATRYRFRGFLVADDPVYLGGPIALQRLAILAAARAAGPGLLTHPTLGLLQVSCETMSVGEDLSGATYSSIEFSFVEAGKPGLPSLILSSAGVSSDVVTAIAGAADAVRILALAGQGASGSGSLPVTATPWSDRVVQLGNDATALARLASALPGNFGRFSRGATSGYLSRIETTAGASVADLVGAAAGQRAAIAAAAETLDATVAGLTVTTTEQDFAAAAGGLLAALSAACADPADAIRLLEQLLAFSPTGLDAGSAIGMAVSSLFRRLAALELVRASMAYQPSSYEDAFAQLVRVTAAIDDAILAAGDAGQDDLFAALRTMRVAVVADLQARGASLTHVRAFIVPIPLPAVVLAQRFYRSASRADELVGEAGGACISPLFMPTSFTALAA